MKYLAAIMAFALVTFWGYPEGNGGAMAKHGGVHITTATATTTRPDNTTQYGAGDLVANSATAGSVVPLSFTLPLGAGKAIKIREVHVVKDTATVTAADFTVHFYSDSPTPSNGDNGAWLTTLSGYIGSVDVGAMVAFASDAHVANVLGDAAAPTHVLDADGIIYALIESNSTYTPGSEDVFTVRIEVEMYVQ